MGQMSNEYKREWARRHRAQELARQRLWPWRKAHSAAVQARRSARRHGVPEGVLTKEIMARLHLLPCAYCGVMPALFVDHVVPFALGGLNDLDNLAPSCDSCNKRRGAYVLNARVGRATPVAGYRFMTVTVGTREGRGVVRDDSDRYSCPRSRP